MELLIKILTLKIKTGFNHINNDKNQFKIKKKMLKIRNSNNLPSQTTVYKSKLIKYHK